MALVDAQRLECFAAHDCDFLHDDASNFLALVASAPLRRFELHCCRTSGRQTTLSPTLIAIHLDSWKSARLELPPSTELEVFFARKSVLDGMTRSVARAVSLVVLDLSESLTTEDDVSIVEKEAQWSSLRYVDMRSTAATDACLRLVSRCPSMQHLNVSCTGGNVTDTLIAEIAKNCGSLQFLDVSTTDGKVTDVSIIEIAKRCTALLHLNVSHTEGQVTDAAIAEVAKQCSSLQFLNVSTTQGKVTDASIIEIAKRCTSLQTLNVNCTKGEVTDTAIAEIAKRCARSLQHLDVSDTQGKVTDVSIALIAKHCASLQQLNVGGTEGKVTHISLRRLKSSVVTEQASESVSKL